MFWLIWADWSWQDWITVISFAIGLIGLVITFATLKKAGSIEKAIEKTKADQLNKIKYISRRTGFIKDLKPIKSKLIGDVNSRRSSGEIQQIFTEVEEVVLNLLECSNHFSEEHKNEIKSCKDFISRSFHGNHILDCEDCNIMRDYIVHILIMLNQEEYYL